MRDKESKIHPISLFDDKVSHNESCDECNDDLDLFEESLLDGHPQLSPDVAEALYEMAFDYYSSGKYQEAIDVFYLLILTDAENAKYWIGIAAAHQMLQEYEDAISGYAFAAMLDEENPMPHLHAAECLFAIQNIDEALSALAAVDQVAGNKKMYRDTVARAAALREAWSTKK